jgi:hypothetical protein
MRLAFGRMDVCVSHSAKKTAAGFPRWLAASPEQLRQVPVFLAWMRGRSRRAPPKIPPRRARCPAIWRYLSGRLAGAPAPSDADPRQRAAPVARSPAAANPISSRRRRSGTLSAAPERRHPLACRRAGSLPPPACAGATRPAGRRRNPRQACFGCPSDARPDCPTALCQTSAYLFSPCSIREDSRSSAFDHRPVAHANQARLPLAACWLPLGFGHRPRARFVGDGTGRSVGFLYTPGLRVAVRNA